MSLRLSGLPISIVMDKNMNTVMQDEKIIKGVLKTGARFLWPLWRGYRFNYLGFYTVA